MAKVYLKTVPRTGDCHGCDLYNNPNISNCGGHVICHNAGERDVHYKIVGVKDLTEKQIRTAKKVERMEGMRGI